MAGATFSRVKNWSSEVLSSSDLNAEIDNILNNFNPDGMDDYSSNATQMQATTDPGEDGSESLATSLSGELERLRFALKEIKGSDVDYWYESAGTTLSELGAAVETTSVPTRIISGATTNNSSQPLFLIPGGDDSITLSASESTPFQYAIDGTTHEITSDVTLSGLLGKSSPTTASVVTPTGSSTSEGDYILGMHGTCVFTDFNSSSGTDDWDDHFVALNDGANTEYMFNFQTNSRMVSGPSFFAVLDELYRSYGFLSDSSASKIVSPGNGNTLTVLQTGWIFVDDEGSLHISYLTPVRSSAAPSATTVGQYWYNPEENSWYLSDGSNFSSTSRILIGVCGIDSSDNCVIARSFDPDFEYKALPQNAYTLNGTTTNMELQATFSTCNISVYQTTLTVSKINWDSSEHLDGSASQTLYYYLKEDGTPYSTDVPPLNMCGTRNGWYHPHETWRYIGGVASLSVFDLALGTSSFDDIAATGERRILGKDNEHPGVAKLSVGESYIPGYKSIRTSSSTTLRLDYYWSWYMRQVFEGYWSVSDLTMTTPGFASATNGMMFGVSSLSGDPGDVVGSNEHNHQWFSGNAASSASSSYDSDGNATDLTNTSVPDTVVKVDAADSGTRETLSGDYYTDPEDSLVQHMQFKLYVRI